MRDHGYSDSLSAGSITAGGTLGILIPPSTIMVIYGIMTETSIGKLFAAGFLPGILAVALALPGGPVHHLARSEGRPAGRARHLGRAASARSRTSGPSSRSSSS